MVLLWN